MKKTLLFFSLLFSSVTLSQLQIDEYHLTNYDYQTGDLQFRDSFRYEYSYLGQGAINSNSPHFTWNLYQTPFIRFQEPTISFTRARRYSVFPTNAYLSYVNQSMNAMNLPEVQNFVDQNSNPLERIEYYYNSVGKPTSILKYYNQGGTFKLVYTELSSYNSANQLIMNGYHGSVNPNNPLYILDSIIYDGSGKVIRKTGYKYRTSTGAYLKTYESIPTYTNGILDFVDFYEDQTPSSSGQLTKYIRSSYTFSSGNFTSYIEQYYQNGVLNPTIVYYVIMDYLNNDLIRSSKIDDGDTVMRSIYTYHSTGLLEDMKHYTKFDTTGWKLLEDEHFTYGPLSASLEEKTPLTITVFPNPTKDIIAISNVEAGNVDITNSMGQIVLRQNGNLSNIDVRNLASGIYTIRFYNDQGVGTTSFVKE